MPFFEWAALPFFADFLTLPIVEWPFAGAEAAAAPPLSAGAVGAPYWANAMAGAIESIAADKTTAAFILIHPASLVGAEAR